MESVHDAHKALGNPFGPSAPAGAFALTLLRGGLAIASLALVVACAPPQGSNPNPPLHGTLLSADPSPPPWPPGTSTCGPCSLPFCQRTDVLAGRVEIEPGRDWPKTPRDMASQAWQVVIADAADQRPFWAQEGSDQSSDIAGGWGAYTATNFHVLKVLKGSAPHWMQLIQIGARRDSLPCSQLNMTRVNSPPPQEGARYILFEWGPHYNPVPRTLPGLTDQADQLPAFRFRIVNGVVHSEADYDPQALAMHTKPQPLNDFLRASGL